MKKILAFLILSIVSSACSLTIAIGLVEENQVLLPESEFPEIAWNELVLGGAVAGNVIIAQTGPDTVQLTGGLNKNIVLLEENAAYFETVGESSGFEWRLYFYRAGEVIFWGLEKLQLPGQLNL